MSELPNKKIPESHKIVASAVPKTLDERLEEIKISKDKEIEIVMGKGAKLIGQSLLDSVPGGKIATTLLSLQEEVSEEVENYKKELLIERCLNKNDAIEESVEKLKQLICNQYGSTLFSKILQILRNTPPDVDLLSYLSNCLRYISATDFVNLFDEHKYMLTVIDSLNPQELALLADSENWPVFFIKGYNTLDSMQPTTIEESFVNTGTMYEGSDKFVDDFKALENNRIMSNWASEFAQAYLRSKDLVETRSMDFIRHSIQNLGNLGLISAHIIKEGKAQVFKSNIGQSLFRYIRDIE